MKIKRLKAYKKHIKGDTLTMPETRNQRRRRRRSEKAKEQENTLNVAAHFATLTNTILKRIESEDTINDMVASWIQTMKYCVIMKLKACYDRFLDFEKNPASRMPEELAKRSLSIHSPHFDPRLNSSREKLRGSFIDFVKSLGFVIKDYPSDYTKLYFYLIDVYIDRASLETQMTSEEFCKIDADISAMYRKSICF